MKIRLAIVPRATPRLGGVERLRGGSEVPIDHAASRPPAAEQIRLFSEAGGTLLAATDVGVPMQIPGIFLHKNLALLVDAGLTPLEALRAATLNPARVLDLEGSLGILEAGKLARRSATSVCRSRRSPATCMRAAGQSSLRRRW